MDIASINTVLILVVACALYWSGLQLGQKRDACATWAHCFAGIFLIAIGLTVYAGVLGGIAEWLSLLISVACIILGMIQLMFIWYPSLTRGVINPRTGSSMTKDHP